MWIPFLSSFPPFLMKKLGHGANRVIVTSFICDEFVVLLFQPDCLDDLAYAIMYETTKLCCRVLEQDVIRARNQVPTNAFILN